jgi:hypothetical protein
MTHTAGYSLSGHRRNEDILEQLTVHPVHNKLSKYKRKLLNHVSRMEDMRYPEQFPGYRPVEREELDDH